MKKYSYQDLRNRAESIDRMAMQTARKLALEAHVDSHAIGISVHNALVSLHYGKPWPEVNYSKCRAAKRQMEKAMLGYRIVDKLYHRLGPDAFDWN